MSIHPRTPTKPKPKQNILKQKQKPKKTNETLKDTMGTEKNLLGSDKYNRAQGKQSTFHLNLNLNII